MSAGDREKLDLDEPYLWDRSGSADRDVVHLERSLEPLRMRAPLSIDALPDRDVPAPSGRVVLVASRRRRVFALAAVMIAAAAVLLFVGLPRPHEVPPIVRAPEPGAAPSIGPVTERSAPAACGSAAAGLAFAAIQGAPRCDGSLAAPSGVLAAGTWLETDAATRVRVDVADIGHVEIDHSSRLRVLETGTAHRLELARGRLEATIDAPPRLFFVNTRAATAVDLGCAYELSVDDGGAGMLRVMSGYVELEPVVIVWGAGPARLPSLVPAGAECSIDGTLGPGIPVWSGAAAEFRDAVRRLDMDSSDGDALDHVLARVGPRDTLVLVHLLERVPDARRGDVLNRLQRAAPAPRGAPRHRTLARDPGALSAWREALKPRWFQPGK